MDSPGKGIWHYQNDEPPGNPALNVENMEKNIFNHISEHLRGNLLDVGCGNGRFNIIFKKYFNKIVGIDLYREPTITCGDFEYRKTDIFDAALKQYKFDVIHFGASFYLHSKYGYAETLKKCISLLKDSHGKIIIIDDIMRLNHTTSNGYYSINEIMYDSDTTIGKFFIYKEAKLFLLILEEYFE